MPDGSTLNLIRVPFAWWPYQSLLVPIERFWFFWQKVHIVSSPWTSICWSPELSQPSVFQITCTISGMTVECTKLLPLLVLVWSSSLPAEPCLEVGMELLTRVPCVRLGSINCTQGMSENVETGNKGLKGHNGGPLLVLGEGRLNFGHQRCLGDPEGRFFQADTKQWWSGRLDKKCGHDLECAI